MPQGGIPLDTMPALILVDSEVIAQSDVRYLRAGIIDALAKWVEFEPYQRHNPHQLALDLKVSTARRATEIFLRWGEAAINANQQQQVNQALEKVIEANIVLAGLANSIRGPLDTPGLAHVIHDTLTHQPELHDWLHGEKVGYSLLIQSLVDNPEGQPDSELLTLLRRMAALNASQQPPLDNRVRDMPVIISATICPTVTLISQASPSMFVFLPRAFRIYFASN